MLFIWMALRKSFSDKVSTGIHVHEALTVAKVLSFVPVNLGPELMSNSIRVAKFHFVYFLVNKLTKKIKLA